MTLKIMYLSIEFITYVQCIKFLHWIWVDCLFGVTNLISSKQIKVLILIEIKTVNACESAPPPHTHTHTQLQDIKL